MTHPQKLLQRLDDIGRLLAGTDGVVALIGLGSAGSETARLDDFSDLDFFVIVQAGYKQAFIEDLGWLTAVHPITYQFLNTADGYKLLFADDIFCEFAIFEPAELAHIPFTAARIIWQTDTFDASLVQPKQPPVTARDADWLVGEAITNLYVGLCRYRRGEKLSAARFVQGYAVDRVLELAALVEEEQPAFRDVFGAERRFEQRFPDTAVSLPHFVPGYDHTPQAALALLHFLETHFTVSPAMKNLIVSLAYRQT
ncbi:MAG: hypothetical protein KJ069_19170 [Anaerolineae bacterium]|nr:hypothetical protein [Anaerolineae bacterium]